MEKKVTIIGGGISGLATALAFKKMGLNVPIFEKKSNNRSNAGIVLGANALESLNFLGVLPQVKELSVSNHQFSIYNNHGKSIFTIQSNRNDHPLYTFIHRKDLTKILLNALSKEQIFYKKKLTFFTTDHKKSQLYFEDGTIVKTNYLLACDGIHSSVRTQLFPNKHLRFAGYTCWRGMVDNFTETSLYTETWGPKGRFGLFPLPNNRLYWYAIKNSQPNDFRHNTWKTDDLYKNFGDYHDPIPEIIERTLDENLTRRDVYDIDSLFQYVYDHILLLGDAAHATTPNLWQGASLAIEDAVYLAKCIEQENKLEEALICFEKQRLKHTKKIIHESWRFGKIAQIDNPFICVVRNKVMKWAPSSFHENRLHVFQNSCK
jgi:FAD-dependent urate hydroxylase